MTDQEILKARARILARPIARELESGTTLQVIEFQLAHEHYAVEQVYAREVYPLKELTPLPGTPAFLRGIINVRGQILAVIDIKRFFDLPETGITDLHTVIIVQANNMEIGILADAVTGARTIPLASIQPSLPTLTGIRAQYLKGVTDQHVVVLDAFKMLTDPKLLFHEKLDA